MKACEVMATKDGQRVLKLLDDKQVSQSKVGRLCDPPVSPSTIGRYIDGLDDGSINPEQWRTLAKALRRVGIDPEQIRAVPPPSEGKLRPDLLPLLDKFDRSQLSALKTLIESEEGHAFVLFAIAERLR